MPLAEFVHAAYLIFNVLFKRIDGTRSPIACIAVSDLSERSCVQEVSVNMHVPFENFDCDNLFIFITKCVECTGC